MIDVEHVDEPGGERAELLRRRADAAVDGGALGGRQLARHAGGSSSASMPVAAATASGVKSRASALDLVEAVAQLGQPAGPRQPLGEEHVHEREQQVARRCRAG